MSRHPPRLAPDCALFMDFDGTLVDFAGHPDSITVPAALPRLLRRLERRLAGAVAIVTGRTLESLDRHLAPLRLPGAGSHGCELRLHGPIEHCAPNRLSAVAAQLRALYGEHDGLLIEDKGAVLAIHYRHAARFAGDAEHALRELVRDLDVEVVRGKCVVEARPRGVDKGAALRELLRRAPFSGRAPLFVGDDSSDEDAIAAAQALGGTGIKVGTGDSAAQWRLADPAAVVAWLEESCAALAKPERDR